MPTGSLHALALVCCVVLTAAASIRWYRSPSARRIAGGIGAGLALAALASSLGLHHCDRGQPLHQWAIPSLCLALVVTVVGQIRVRRALAAALAMLAIMGTLHYAAVVHGETYIGRSDPVTHGDEAPIRARPLWHTPLTGLYEIE